MDLIKYTIYWHQGNSSTSNIFCINDKILNLFYYVRTFENLCQFLKTNYENFCNIVSKKMFWKDNFFNKKVQK